MSVWIVCKALTGYPRLADADGKMRIKKCFWKKKVDNKQSKRKKTRNADGKKKIIINKQTNN